MTHDVDITLTCMCPCGCEWDMDDECYPLCDSCDFGVHKT